MSIHFMPGFYINGAPACWRRRWDSQHAEAGAVTPAEYLAQVGFPLRFRILIIMMRAENETSINLGESQPLPWFLS
eukprot:COSAG01_NODE_2087_length_8456_cov_2.656456_10_plen_76_part_00